MGCPVQERTSLIVQIIWPVVIQFVAVHPGRRDQGQHLAGCRSHHNNRAFTPVNCLLSGFLDLQIQSSDHTAPLTQIFVQKALQPCHSVTLVEISNHMTQGWRTVNTGEGFSLWDRLCQGAAAVIDRSVSP